ncbi:glutathione S-transferase [Panus rudis PR-1116 ss-1]|nr:glutathione S-transferase [Panus rudis PR-1116 ss-1]
MDIYEFPWTATSPNHIPHTHTTDFSQRTYADMAIALPTSTTQTQSNKQFTVYSERTSHCFMKTSPVLATLEELRLTYNLRFSDDTQQTFEQLPVLIDHSRNNHMLWEVNTILLYLVENYDTERRISVADTTEKATQMQWLMIQQSIWQSGYGSTSRSEVQRTLGILEQRLSTRSWLVGERCSIADLAFIFWIHEIVRSGSEEDFRQAYPSLTTWESRLYSRSSVRSVSHIFSAAPAS